MRVRKDKCRKNDVKRRRLLLDNFFSNLWGSRSELASLSDQSSRRNPNRSRKQSSLRTSCQAAFRRDAVRHLRLEQLEQRVLLAFTYEPTTSLHELFVEQQLDAGPGLGQPDQPNAPGTDSSIEGIDFFGDAINSGFFHIPPDPIGAVGLNHVVSVVNTSIEWHTKAGVQQNSQRLGHNGTTASGSFFAPLSPVNSTFDPKVIYDKFADRFVVVTLERTDDNDGSISGDAADTSRILVAVSDDSDPNGTWRFLAINAKTNISGVDRWADYPGFAVDEEAVYITNNMFGFGSSGTFGGVRLWIIDKGVAAGFYAGGAASVTVHDPCGRRHRHDNATGLHALRRTGFDRYVFG